MYTARLAGMAILLGLASGAAWGQTGSTPISFSGCIVQNLGGHTGGTTSTVDGGCSVSPYGAMTLTLTYTLHVASCPVDWNVQFVLSSANGSFTATNPSVTQDCSGDSVSGSLTINNGSGAFAGATGSIDFTITIGGLSAVIQGTGTLTLPPLTGPGGPDYKAVVCDGPGGSGYPLELVNPSGATDGTVEVCASGTATATSVSTSGFPTGLGEVSSTPPRLWYTGSGSPFVAPRTPSLGAPYTTVYLTSPPLNLNNVISISITACPNPAPGTVSTTTCYLVVYAPSGPVPANTSAALPLSINPAGMMPGIYTAAVSIGATPAGAQPALAMGSKASSAGTTTTIPIGVLVTGGGPMLSVSATGLAFEAVAGVDGTLSQTIAVANVGDGSMTFAASASTLSGGSWLSASQTPDGLTVAANPAGLAPGAYFGRVDVSAVGAANSPQSAVVELTVSAPAAGTTPRVAPAGLIFTAPAGANPASQTVQVLNVSSQSLTISMSRSAQASWLSASAPASAVATGQSLTETVAVDTTGLSPGVYHGTLSIQGAPNNSSYPVAVVLIVTPAGGSCTPTQLVPVFTSIANTFQIPAGLATRVDARVTDDCGTPLESGSVVAYFPEGDPPAALAATGNGVWSGTWLPRHVNGGVATAGVVATSGTAKLYGSAAVSGTVAANTSVPSIDPGGVVSAASLAVNGPLAPGGYISIFGSNLAASSGAAQGYPFPATLGGTRVLLGGEPLPLEYAGSGQINAVVPYDASVNGVQQLVVQQNNMYSLPETVMVATAQPAVFTQDQSGSGAGAILVAKADGSQFLNTPSAPASAGDVLLIYCTGLGAVSPAVPAGAAAPSTPLSRTVNPVTATVGGQMAQVQFAGLAPTYAGLYQVNVVVPEGVTAGTNVPVILTEAGASSPPVTLAIQ